MLVAGPILVASPLLGIVEDGRSSARAAHRLKD